MKNLYRRLCLIAAICLTCCLLRTAHAAEPPQGSTVTVSRAATLRELIEQIRAQSRYRFSYQGDLIDGVRIRVADGTYPVDRVLTRALEGTGLTFTIKLNDIVITRAKAAVAREAAAAERRLSGRITDARTKEPIVGASVWLKDTSIGTITDYNGAYTLSFSGNYAFLSVSFLGYATQELRIGASDSLNVELTEDQTTLDDVVVVGYGTQKKASIIGAISSVPVSGLIAPVSRVSSSLAGQLAGITTVQRSGEPGAGSTFWIRGISTFQGNSSPLVLVDGIERDMDLVDPEDIREFSILKDASATAIYGVRGANGVVLITTRTGMEGKPQIQLKVECGLITPTKIPDMIDSKQFVEMYNEAAGYEFYSEAVRKAYRTGSDPDLYPDVDWVGELYKKFSSNQKVNMNVSGGGSTAKYYISGGFYNENGLFTGDNMKSYDTSVFYRRFNFRANVDVKLHRYTTLNVNLATTFERKNEPGTSSNTIWDYALRTSPNAFPRLFSDGSLAGPPADQGENPYVLLTQTGYVERFYNTAQSLFGITQDLDDWVTKGLTVQVKASFDARNYTTHSRRKTPQQFLAQNRDEDGNLILTETRKGEESLRYSESHSGYRTLYLEGTINYARRFGRHNVGALFLYQQSQRNKVGVSNSENALPYRHQGIAGRVTYDFDGRYFVEGNFGYNGSENFSPGRRFGFFPSIAAGWLVSNERFFGRLADAVDMLKLKFSYGLVGNDQIGSDSDSKFRRFIYNETIVDGTSYYFGKNISAFNSIRLGDWPNDRVGWEKSRKMNVGIDLSLFHRIKIQADYFSEKRTGIFLERNSIPDFGGVSTLPYVNIGKMNNAGFDASLEYHQQIGQVQLTVRGNFTYARNEIVDMDQPDWAYPYMNQTGHPRYQKFGYVAVGLFRDQEDIDTWTPQELGSVQAGDIKYLDLNGDGAVNSYDVKALGYPDIPEIVYGFGFSLKWKALDFSAFFQGVGHVNFFTNTTSTQAFTGRNIREDAVFADVYGHYWSERNPDPHARYPRLSTGVNTNNNQLSTFWMVNGRYLRLKNLEIGYTLPKRFSTRLHMEGLRIYLSGVNLLTFSPFKLWDPDLQTGATNYPNNRVYNVGLSLAF